MPGPGRIRHKIRNLGTRQHHGTTATPFRAEVPGHDAAMPRPAKQAPPAAGRVDAAHPHSSS